MTKIELVGVIFTKLNEMKNELQRKMNEATEQEQDEYLEECLRETEKLNGLHANYRLWCQCFCDIRDGYDPDRFLYA